MVVVSMLAQAVWAYNMAGRNILVKMLILFLFDNLLPANQGCYLCLGVSCGFDFIFCIGLEG